MWSWKRTAALIWLPLVLTACGFHPRGESARPSSVISPVYITGLSDRNPFVQELIHQLQLNGISITSTADNAASILHLSRLKQHRSVFSVNANNKAVEHEITRSLHFSVEHPPGNRVLNDQELSTRYIVYNPGGELLGRTREAELRRQDAYRELAQRLLSRLSKIR